MPATFMKKNVTAGRYDSSLGKSLLSPYKRTLLSADKSSMLQQNASAVFEHLPEHSLRILEFLKDELT